jgi:hypothetical protein
MFIRGSYVSRKSIHEIIQIYVLILPNTFIVQKSLKQIMPQIEYFYSSLERADMSFIMINDGFRICSYLIT